MGKTVTSSTRAKKTVRANKVTKSSEHKPRKKKDNGAKAAILLTGRSGRSETAATGASRPIQLSATMARDTFSDIVNNVAFGKKRFVITRQGKKLVAVIPAEDLEALEALEAREDERDLEAVRVAWAEQGDEAPDDWETAKARLGLK